MDMQQNGYGNNYIIEIRKVGNLLKVSAADPVTLTEISITAPARGYLLHDIKKIAVRKLEYVINKKVRKC